LDNCSITKESIIDVEAKVVEVATPVAGCSQQNVELLASQIWVVSASAPQLPLQIDDASRPEKADVSCASFQKLLIKMTHAGP
jgi:aspartyl/asparaginyl-tRNA synthetase